MAADAQAAPSDMGRHYQDWQRSGRWRPLEIVAMVLGFIVFWPIGLAILGFKIWQKRSGYPGDLSTFTQERFEQVRSMSRGWSCGSRRAYGFGGSGGGFGGGSHRSGNQAFDAWKEAELARLEEERRKLDAAQKEFNDYLDHLRQAKDREEFDRFMNERNAAKARGEAGWKPFSDKPAD